MYIYRSSSYIYIYTLIPHAVEYLFISTGHLILGSCDSPYFFEASSKTTCFKRRIFIGIMITTDHVFQISRLILVSVRILQISLTNTPAPSEPLCSSPAHHGQKTGGIPRVQITHEASFDSWTCYLYIYT